jgi:hypothetical protein
LPRPRAPSAVLTGQPGVGELSCRLVNCN